MTNSRLMSNPDNVSTVVKVEGVVLAYIQHVCLARRRLLPFRSHLSLRSVLQGTYSRHKLVRRTEAFPWQGSEDMMRKAALEM